MSESAASAVFLSYASQDAAAARCLCTALQAAGLEVWFDQSELRGGDAWDQKIREQVETCALFIPIISQQTQARREGYFRLEWNLADDRTHLMAGGTPFIVPVVIDDTRERGALVPKSFLAAQWTRLPGGQTPAAFVRRVQGLLGAPVAPEHVPAGGSAGPLPVQTSPRRGAWFWVTVAAGLAALGCGAYFALRPPAAPPRSIAVMPFANLSDRGEDRHFAEGVYEEILTNLALVRELSVIGRTTVQSLQDGKKSVRQIGRELGVGFVLESGVRHDGRKVRLSPSLTRTDTGAVVWAQVYERDLTDVFAIQAEIATTIAGQLQAVIRPDEKKLIERAATANPAAYDRYLQSRAARADVTQSPVKNRVKRVELLREAVKLDPGFAKAWAELAIVQAFEYSRTESRPAAQLAEATAALERAVQLAPGEPEVMIAQGRYHALLHRDYDRSRMYFERALRLFPNHTEAHLQMGSSHLQQLRLRDAVASFREAVRLDPGSSGLANYLHGTLRAARRYEELIAELQRPYVEARLQAYQLGIVAFLARGSTEEMEQAVARLTAEEGARPWGVIRRLDWAVRTGDAAGYRELVRNLPPGAENAAPFPIVMAFNEPPAKYRRAFYSALFRAAGGDVAGAREELGVIEDLRGVLNPPAEGKDSIEYDRELPRRRRVIWTELARWEALLGHKAEAVRYARMAIELRPDSRNAWEDPVYSVNLAFVYAWTGEKDRAIGEYARLLRVSHSGLNVHEMKHHPAYAPLRGDPRFDALLADPKNNEPLY